MKTQALLFVCLIVIMLESCITNPEGTAIDTNAPLVSLSLDLTLVEKQYSLGERVNATVTLTNTGKESILVKKRFGIGHILPDISFIINGPKDKQTVPRGYISEVPLSVRDFGILEPREYYSPGKFSLDLYYDFTTLGEYTIQCFYQNTSDPGDGRIAWKGTVASNVVVIEIVP